MPIKTELDEELGIVVHTILGNLKTEEVLEAQRRVYLDEDHDPRMPVLWDARLGRSSGLTYEDLRSLMERSRPLWDRMGPGRTAIVTGSRADFGMARMYESLAHEMPRDIVSFDDYEEAIEWLTGGPEGRSA
jgi:hypothetical protein